MVLSVAGSPPNRSVLYHSASNCSSQGSDDRVLLYPPETCH